MTDARMLLLASGLISGGVLLGDLAVSIRSPTWRFWPHGDRDWTFWVGWAAWTVYFASLAGLAVLDWWGWYRPPTVLVVTGTLLVLSGAVLAIWGARDLGLRESTGLEGRLYIGGPYRYSRNPQYVGYVAMLVSGAAFAGSWRVAVLAAVGLVWFLVAPHAEEPWLRDQYGEAYETYRESIPRFVGRSSQHPPQQERTNVSRRDDP